jgi:hypothetical protein
LVHRLFFFASFNANFLSTGSYASYKLSNPRGHLDYSWKYKPSMLINMNSTCHFPSLLRSSEDNFLFRIINCETRVTIKTNVTQKSTQNRSILWRQKLYRIIFIDPGIPCSKPSASVIRIQCCTLKYRCLIWDL